MAWNPGAARQNELVLAHATAADLQIYDLEHRPRAPPRSRDGPRDAPA
jgi:hypothetical protein